MIPLKIQDESIVSDFVEKYSENVYDRIQNILNNGIPYFKNKKKKFRRLTNKQKKTIKELFTEEKIKNLMSLTPKEMIDEITELKKEYKELHNKNSLVYQAVYNAFVSYTYEKKFNKFDFIKSLDIKTCPYCNRNYIYALDKNKKVKPQIDHFYPKHIYPYLGMSFYNLIPSCAECNGFNSKGKIDSFEVGLKNPYEIKYDDFKFNFDISSINIVNSKIDENSIKTFFDKKLEANDKIFNLEILYEEHRDIIIELYQKSKLIYPDDFFVSLEKDIGISLTKEEIYKLKTCGYFNNEDLHKRPLSKLIKDISEELGLI